jgi:hypothetical protein
MADSLARERRIAVPLVQTILAVVATMLVVSFVAGLIWHWLFDATMPSYLSGLVGGATAVPVWELLKRVEIR